MASGLAPPVGGGPFVYTPLALLVLGGTLGGLAIGSVLALIGLVVGELDGASAAVALAGGGLAVAALAWPPLKPFLPERACQVSTLGKDADGREAGFKWGFGLGTGVTTFVVTPGFYALVAVAVAQPRPIVALCLMGWYGFARTATVGWFALRHRSVAARHADVPLPGLGMRARLRVPLLVSVVGAVVLAVS